jgi:hypothetical protein
MAAALSALARAQQRIAELEHEVTTLRNAPPPPATCCSNCDNMRMLHDTLVRDTQRLMTVVSIMQAGRQRAEDELEAMGAHIGRIFQAHIEARRAETYSAPDAQQQLMHWYHAMAMSYAPASQQHMQQPHQAPLSVLADAATTAPANAPAAAADDDLIVRRSNAFRANA